MVMANKQWLGKDHDYDYQKKFTLIAGLCGTQTVITRPSTALTPTRFHLAI